jgi:hypothetical protein
VIERESNVPLKAVACGRKPAIDGHNHLGSPIHLGGYWMARLLAPLQRCWRPLSAKSKLPIWPAESVLNPARTRLLQFKGDWQAKPEIMVNKCLIKMPTGPALMRHVSVADAGIK